MRNPEWKGLILQCLNSTEFMALSTYGDDGVWANPVYFSWDKVFNLYFISQLDCTHMNNIASNAEVACTIYPTNRPEGDDVFGLYVKGQAAVLSEKQDIDDADDVYFGRVYTPEQTEQKNRDTYRNNPSWHFVKISLNGLWYFDTRYFDENRVAVPREVWGEI